MGTTFPIPLTTLTVGVHRFGPATIADADTEIVIVNDRTVAGGMNSLTAADTLTLQSEQSDDGGTTWLVLAVNQIGGGIVTGKNGQTIATDRLTTFLQPGTSRQIRATVTVAGASIAVQGSLTTQ